MELVSCNDRIRIQYVKCWGEILILGQACVSGRCMPGDGGSERSEEAPSLAVKGGAALLCISIWVSCG